MVQEESERNGSEEEDDDQEELYEHYKFVAEKGQGLMRVDKFLTTRLPNTSRNKIQKAANSGNILVNGDKVKSNYKVKPLDKVSLVLPYPPRKIELIPQDIPIDVIYEDDEIIVINKESGMVVHPGYGNYTGTLVNALIHHFQNLPSRDGDDTRPGLVHRLDKNTTGIMVIAKTDDSLVNLAKQFFDRTIERNYIALVWGDFDEDKGSIKGHIGRNVKNRKVMQVFPEGDQGKHAVTHYEVLERFGYVTLVRCKLETGRTHQIRIHFKHIGHPLFNDMEYGGDSILKGTTFTKYRQFIKNCFKILPRQALHAKTLAFPHPKTDEFMKFDSEIPDDMNTVLEKWRRYTANREVE